MTDLDCRAVATAAQHNVYCHKLEHRHQQRKEDFPDVEAVSALHVYCHPDLGSSLGGAADEFISRLFSQAANFPLGHVNVARAIELPHTSLLYQRNEITIRKTWLQIENQLLTVEREA